MRINDSIIAAIMSLPIAIGVVIYVYPNALQIILERLLRSPNETIFGFGIIGVIALVSYVIGSAWTGSEKDRKEKA